MTTLGITKSNNKALEQRLLKSIKELPAHRIESTCAHHLAFDLPIGELTEKQKSNLNELLR